MKRKLWTLLFLLMTTFGAMTITGCGSSLTAYLKSELPKALDERGQLNKDIAKSLLDAGFIDSFRYLYPNKENAYTWWSYMRKAREKDVGWRIDYFIVSKDMKQKIKEAKIYSNVMGSDHCPVELEIEI